MKPMGLIFVAISLLGTSLTTRAQTPQFDPHPIFIGPQMIVLSFSVASDHQDLALLIPQLEVQQELVAYVSSLLAQEGVGMPVTDSGHFKDPPTGVFLQNVIMVFVRADIASINIDQRPPTVVGSVSVWIRRGEDTLLSSEPMTFFGAQNEPDVVSELVKRAAVEQVQRSVINPIAMIAK